MAKRDKTKAELRAELAQLRDRLAALEAEAALHEPVDFSLRMMNSMLDGLSIVDVDGTYLAVNDAFCQITGFAREELLGTQPPYAYWPPEHRDAIHAVFEEMRTGEPRNLELVFMRKSGERFPVVLAPAVVRDATGNAVRYLATLQEVTDRKRAEVALHVANATLERRVAERTAELVASNEQLQTEVEQRCKAEAALAKSERRFRNYFEQGLIGMVVTAFDKRWLEVNDRCCEMLGYPREELLATTWPELTHPDDLAADIAQFERLLAGAIEHYTLEKRFLHKDGRAVHTIIAVRLFRDEDGSFDHVVCLIQDITEQKLAEEALRQERRTLKHLLRASDRERQLIAYDVHDGLAQHLAAAVMQFESFDALKDDYPRQAETAHAVGVEMVRQAHAEARRLISGVRPPILDESGVIAAIDHLVHDPRTCPDQTIDWQADLKTHRLAPIVENALFRMMQEALGNARLHSRSKGVKVSLAEKDDVLELVVEDRGVGFDPDTVSDECFGLRSIRERARLLGGTLSIRSAPGRGTRLHVTLPAAGEAEA